MSLTKKNPVINIPANIILNEKGENYFSSLGVPLKSVSGINGRKRFGFCSNILEVPLVKTISKGNFLEEVYTREIDLISRKSEIQDITKLLFYSLIYNKFIPHLREVLLNTNLIEKYNMKNPSTKITHDTKFDEQKIKAFFASRKEEISKMITNILKKPYKIIDEDKDIKEKDEKKNILKTMLNHITLREWFLFFLITTDARERDIVTERISDLMIIYLGKTKIADYLGFLVVELIQNAEKATLEKAAKIKGIVKKDDDSRTVDNILKDVNTRNKIIEISKQMGYFVELSWKFKDVGDRLNSIRYEITVSNKGVIPKAKRNEVKNKSQTDIEGLSLADFYQDTGQELGAGLGLFYISYINEESVKQGIKFSSIIDSDDDKDITYVILKITV